MVHKKYLWAAVCSLLLIAFTVYILLDTFVIARVYSTVSSSEKSTNQSSSNSTSESRSSVTGTATENSYSDGKISITITEYRAYDTSIYVADVQVSSAEYLRTAFAQGAYGRNVTETTSSIAKDSGAILAINGDYYGAQEKGYVLRNGTLYRSSAVAGREDLVIYADGTFGIISESDISAEDLLSAGAQQVLSFGPALIENSEISVTASDEVDKAKSSNPRTAIGVVDGLHYLFVVSDGRTSESEGLTLLQLAEFMQSLGAKTAYNLDGGGSSTMYFNGKVINNPTSNGNSIEERKVSDIVYIG